jgi:hypothetical protein
MTNHKEICIINSVPANGSARALPYQLLRRANFASSEARSTYCMERIFSQKLNCLASIAGIAIFSANVSAQSPAVADSFSWGFPMLLIAVVAIAGAAFFFWRRSRSEFASTMPDSVNHSYYQSNESYDMEGVDADEELEWLRKVRKPKTPKAPAKPVEPQLAVTAFARNTGVVNIDTKAFQERMRKMQYSQLPINSFLSLRPARQYEPLPYSEDPSLLSAIEQAGEEYEEDEAVRELAVKVLAAFRTRNSIEALTQIALYDLSSNLRSKAVTTLTDFDHPSVFEALLLACADPTREVRAAAARGLFRLSFDRADAWKRIADTNDEYRMRHAARAAIESEIAVKSFERLVHEDMKVAQEAFALVAFLIAADEAEVIFEAIKSHKDERVRFALLHVIRVQADERMAGRLNELSKLSSLSPEVLERVVEAQASISAVAARAE